MRLDRKLKKINDKSYLDKLETGIREAKEMIKIMKKQIKNGYKENEIAGKG